VPVSLYNFLREGLPLGVLELVVIAYSRGGIFLLQESAGVAAVGHLYVALRATEQVVAVGGALGTSAMPVFARLAHEKQPQAIRRAFLKYSATGLALTIGIAAFMSLGAEPILRIVKPEYLEAAAPLAILSWAAVVMFQNNLSASALYSFGRYRAVASWSSIGLLIYFGAAAFLIPAYGARGAAFSTLLMETIGAGVYLWLVLGTIRRSAEQEAPAVATAS